MNVTSLRARVSFQMKVLVPVVTVMVLLIAAAMWIVNEQITGQVHAEATKNLELANTYFRKFQEARQHNLLSQYRAIGADSRYKGWVQTGESTETADNLPSFLNSASQFLDQQLHQNNGATVAMFTFINSQGEQFARARLDPNLDVEEFQARSLAAISNAFEGQPDVGTINVGSRLFYAVWMPVSSPDGSATGVYTFGMEIGADAAREIKQLYGNEILLFANGKVVASSLTNAQESAALAEQFGASVAGEARADGGASREIRLESGHFLCRAGRFTAFDKDAGVGYLLLSPYEQSLMALRSTQQMLLVVGLLGIALSTVIVWFLIGRVTQPLRQLRDSAEAVGRGDFSHRVEVASRDECGELAAVFNQMTENIKTSRDELEKMVETLKATQNQLIQSEKLSGIGEFVAGVAHELNNPLTSVMGFAELLQQSDMPEPSRRYLDVISKSAKRCQKIVASLLSFARRHAPERKVVCVNDIVESAVEILQYQMRTSNIEVIVQLDPRLPATEVDSHQMQQVFLNIINNARQAMEGGANQGCLRVTTETAEGKVRVTFSDNGPGIPPENITKIFNPFFTTKEVGKGTGLGLSLCYGIVSEHGGTITPRSEPGQGASFVIELPISSALADAAQKKATAPLPAQAKNEGVGKRVLVIDDEDTILQMISTVLSINGYKVDVARDGETALRRLGQYHYDLALCDWKMPGLNGQQVFERLDATNPEMSRRLIFITGDVVNEKTQQFLSTRHKVCLSKPFTLVEFRTAINRVMAAGGG